MLHWLQTEESRKAPLNQTHTDRNAQVTSKQENYQGPEHLLGFSQHFWGVFRFLVVLLLSDTASGLIYICMLRITSDTADGLIHLHVMDHRRYCQWLDTFICYSSPQMLLVAWYICMLQITVDAAGGLTLVYLDNHGYCWRLDTSVCYRSV